MDMILGDTDTDVDYDTASPCTSFTSTVHATILFPFDI